MNTLQISYFMTVAEQRSFSKAAEMLYVSQPAVSTQITRLEEEWGFRLFNRRYREATLTPAGQNMYDLLSQVRRDFDHALARSRQMPDAPIISLYVGVTECLICDKLVESVRKFEKDFPQVRVCLEVGPMSRNTFSHDYANSFDIVVSQESYLAGSRCDLGVLPYSSGKSAFFIPTRLFEAKGKEKPDFSDLEGQTIYMSAGMVSGAATEFCHSLCESMGIRIGGVVERPNISSALLSLDAGEGALLLDSCSVLNGREDLAVLETPMDIRWVVAWRRDIGRDYVKELAEYIFRGTGGK